MPDPKKPPIVWHLDTEDIEDYYHNPADRLTRIRDAMREYQDPDSRKPLDDILTEIRAICKEKRPPDTQT
jgi:hypothetical protein